MVGKRALILTLLSVLLLSGCTSKNQIWYGVSDRYGWVIVFDSSKNRGAVVSVSADIVQEYQIESESLSPTAALQSLFGLKADHTLVGQKSEWIEIVSLIMEYGDLPYNHIRPNFETTLNLVAINGELLSKSEVPDKLKKLSDSDTSRKEIEKLLSFLHKRGYTYYDTARFLRTGSDPTHMRRWLTSWIDEILR